MQMRNRDINRPICHWVQWNYLSLSKSLCLPLCLPLSLSDLSASKYLHSNDPTSSSLSLASGQPPSSICMEGPPSNPTKYVCICQCLYAYVRVDVFINFCLL